MTKRTKPQNYSVSWRKSKKREQRSKLKRYLICSSVVYVGSS